MGGRRERAGGNNSCWITIGGALLLLLLLLGGGRAFRHSRVYVEGFVRDHWRGGCRGQRYVRMQGAESATAVAPETAEEDVPAEPQNEDEEEQMDLMDDGTAA